MLVKEAINFLRRVFPVQFFDDPRLIYAPDSGALEIHPNGGLTHFQSTPVPEYHMVIEANELNVFVRPQNKYAAKTSGISPMNPKPVRRQICRMRNDIRRKNEIKLPDNLNEIQAKARVVAFAGAAINLEKKGD